PDRTRGDLRSWPGARSGDRAPTERFTLPFADEDGDAMTILEQLPPGCRMPAEWEPHEATWIAWPHNQDDWPDKFDAIPWAYAEIVRHLHRSERVAILVNNDVAADSARGVLERCDLDWARIDLVTVPTDRVWTRDYGPL